MTKKTSPTGNLPWKRTLLSTAIALAASHQAYAAECDTTISGNVAGCEITTAAATVTVGSGATVSDTDTGIYASGSGLDAIINNNGTISADVSAWSDTVYGVYADGTFAGTINNKGTISAISEATSTTSANISAYGIYINGNLDGKITNTGTINAEAYTDGASTSDQIYSYGIYVNGDLNGEISNAKNISSEATTDEYAAYAYGIYVDGNVYGTISNSSTIDVTATVEENGTDYAYAYGIETGTVITDSSITNSGTINVTAQNLNSSDSSAYAYGILTDAVNGSITNSGAINATATHEGSYSAYAYGIDTGSVSGSITNSGNINANATQNGTSDAYAYGINTGYVYSSGSITNSGNINAIAQANGYWASAYGLYVDGDMSGDINNTGSISAQVIANSGSAYGMYINDDLWGDLTNEGTISAQATGADWVSAYGVYVNDNIGGDFTNSGTISAKVFGEEDGGAAYGIHLYDGDLSGDLINEGAISATANVKANWGSAYGISLNSISSDASIVNTGSISATVTDKLGGGSAYGITTDSISGNITNEGTITASVAGRTWGSAYGITTGNLNNSADVVNNGSISLSVNSEQSGGSAYGISTSTLNNGSAVENNGTIDINVNGYTWVSGYGITTGNYSNYGSIVSNSGEINIQVASVNSGGSAYGIYTGYDSDGTIINTGNISLDVSGRSNWVGAYGIVNWWAWGNAGDGSSITNDGNIKANAYAAEESGSAYGIFIGTNNSTYAEITNNGSIEATVSVDTWAGAWGIRGGNIYGDTDGAGIVNNGTIVASANARGNIQPVEASASAYGIDLNYVNSSGGAVEISNSGSITATATGHDWVGAYGIDLGDAWSMNNAGDVISNSGDITAYAETDAYDDSASAYGISGSTNLNASATLSNSGDISAVAVAKNGSQARAYGINLDYVNGNVTNTGNINAEAYSPTDGHGDNSNSAYGIRINNFNGTLTNDGSITAYAEGMLDNTGENEVYAIYAGGSGSIVNNGHLSGAVRTGGNFTAGADSTHEFVLQSVDTSVNNYIGGDANLVGTEFSVKAVADSSFKNGDVFEDYVDVNGTLTVDADQLGTLTDNLLLYSFDLVYDAYAVDPLASPDDDLDIMVSREAITKNVEGMYSGIAAALDKMQNAGTCNPADSACQQAQAMLNAANNAHSVEELQKILANAAPAFGGQTAFATARSSGAVNDAILARLGSGQSSGDAMSNNKVWVKIISSDASRDETDEAVGYDIENGGIVVGGDTNVNDSTRVGVALAMTRAEIDGQGAISAQNVEINQAQVLVYADWELANNSFVNVQGGYGQGDNTLTTLAGEVDYDSSLFSLRGAYGSTMKLSDSWSVTPEGSLTYIAVSEDAYTLGLLNVDERDSDTLEAGVDGKFAYAINDKAKFTTHVGLAYDLLGDKTEVDSSFISGPAFSTEADQDAVSVILGLGLDLAQTESTSFSVNYDYMDRGDFDSNTVSAKVSHSF